MIQEETSKNALFEKLSQLYTDMEEAYNPVAKEIGLSCEGCPDNCCNSYFQHHTYIEWAYVWEGMELCTEQKQQGFIRKAEDCVEQSQLLLAQGRRPDIMCPVNDEGLCRLYKHRLMICRLHGVPNRLVKPNAEKMKFPGCFRSQALCSELNQVPVLDRTDLYRRLASLEMAFLGPKIKSLPRVRLTLAEMLVQGPPPV